MDEITLVSVIVLGVALLLPVLSEWLAENDRMLRWVKYFIFIAYILANLNETLLFRTTTPEARAKLTLFWSYREAFGIQANGGFPIRITDGELLKEIILNVLLYIPLGYLLPFTWPSLAMHAGRPHCVRQRLSWLWRFSWETVCIGFLCSAATELIQLMFHVGFFEFDDIWNNTAGCIIGAMLYSGLLRRHIERRAGQIRK